MARDGSIAARDPQPDLGDGCGLAAQVGEQGSVLDGSCFELGQRLGSIGSPRAGAELSQLVVVVVGEDRSSS